MKILWAGGSGIVGAFITPLYLMKRHELRMLDPRKSGHNVEHISGSMTGTGDLRRTLDGMDTFIDVAMLSPQGGSSTAQD